MNTAEWRQQSMGLLSQIKAPLPPGVPPNMAQEFLRGRDKQALKQAIRLVALAGKFLSGRCMRCLTPVNVDGECYACTLLEIVGDLGKALEEGAAGVHPPQVQRANAAAALNELVVRVRSHLDTMRERAVREGLVTEDGAPKVPVENIPTPAEQAADAGQKLILTDS